MSASQVPFVRSDIYILAAVTEHWPPGSRQKLQEFANDYDWLNRGIPTFEEVSFGLMRLVTAGYVTTERVPGKMLRLIATPSATAMGKRARASARTLGDVFAGFESELGCKPCPEPEVEDRSLGQLPDFNASEWDRAVSAYHRWFDAAAKRLLGISLDRNSDSVFQSET